MSSGVAKSEKKSKKSEKKVKKSEKKVKKSEKKSKKSGKKEKKGKKRKPEEQPSAVVVEPKKQKSPPAAPQVAGDFCLPSFPSTTELRTKFVVKEEPTTASPEPEPVTEASPEPETEAATEAVTEAESSAGAADGTENATDDASKKKRKKPKRKLPPGVKGRFTYKELVLHSKAYKGRVVGVSVHGCFVDIGCHSDGFVHVSRLADGYVQDVGDLVKMHDEVECRVLECKKKKKSKKVLITLSMQSEKMKETEVRSVEKHNGGNEARAAPVARTPEEVAASAASKKAKQERRNARRLAKKAAAVGDMHAVPPPAME